MVDKKNKKKTLTISTNTSKKIDLSSLTSDGKKTFSIEKKTPFRSSRDNKSNTKPGIFKKPETVKKNTVRKFIEQQATKNFIKKDEKATLKTKLKLDPLSLKRDFKLTVSRAMNVEEVEIKQRSLASVKRARLKEKKSGHNNDEKKESIKVIKDVNIPEQITIQELSNRMAERSADIIKFYLI